MNNINTNGLETIYNLKKRIKLLEDQPEPHLFAEAIKILREDIVRIQLETEPEPFHNRDGTLITCCNADGNIEEPLAHCFDKISEIVGKHILPWKLTCEATVEGGGSDGKPLTDRELLQVGYNLGRMAEITGWGRAVWDRLKEPIEARDWEFVELQMGYLSNYATGLCQKFED